LIESFTGLNASDKDVLIVFTVPFIDVFIDFIIDGDDAIEDPIFLKLVFAFVNGDIDAILGNVFALLGLVLFNGLLIEAMLDAILLYNDSYDYNDIS
jgi:hypothetical protein